MKKIAEENEQIKEISTGTKRSTRLPMIQNTATCNAKKKLHDKLNHLPEIKVLKILT